MPEQKTELSSKEIVQKIQEQLKDSGWHAALRFWWIDSQFEEIIDTLKQYTKEGNRWVPGAGKMLRWLKETPYDQVKVVMLIDESSNLLDYHQGIPLHSEPV